MAMTASSFMKQSVEILSAGNSMPPGTVAHFSGTIDMIPEGWVTRYGQELSRTGEGAALFAILGTQYGIGDGATTFNVMDDRGLFDRGLMDGHTVGEYQTDEFKSHTHSGETLLGQTLYINQTMFGMQMPSNSGNKGTIGYTGSSETRPKNRQYIPIIKL